MRKIISFFIGLCIVAIMFGSIVGAAAIYDTARRINIETYFFQPNNLSGERVGVPASPTDLGPDKMRRMLVAKYLNEYFYVIPDTANVESRMAASSTLARMSTPDVFAQWRAAEGETIQQLADAGAFRTVELVDMTRPTDSDFWTVTCHTTTWMHPNDMSEEPLVRKHVLYMGLIDENMMDLRENLDIPQYIEEGGDPAAMFRFGVGAIGIQQD